MNLKSATNIILVFFTSIVKKMSIHTLNLIFEQFQFVAFLINSNNTLYSCAFITTVELSYQF